MTYVQHRAKWAAYDGCWGRKGLEGKPGVQAVTPEAELQSCLFFSKSSVAKNNLPGQCPTAYSNLKGILV